MTSKDTDLGLIRLPEVLQLFPVSKSSWWAGIKTGRYPQSIKIGPRMTAWRKKDILKLLADPQSTFNF